jgi:hypothetical protein
MGFRGEEGLEHVVDNPLGNARAGISHAQHRILARSDVAEAADIDVVEIGVGDSQPCTEREGRHARGWLPHHRDRCEVVGPVRSVEDGLDLAGNAELDAAILDVNLAGQNSFSVANALKLRGIPFAFATGDSGVDKASGFADPILLNKPFMFEDVKAVVGKLLAPPA